MLLDIVESLGKVFFVTLIVMVALGLFIAGLTYDHNVTAWGGGCMLAYLAYRALFCDNGPSDY